MFCGDHDHDHDHDHDRRSSTLFIVVQLLLSILAINAIESRSFSRTDDFIESVVGSFDSIEESRRMLSAANDSFALNERRNGCLHLSRHNDQDSRRTPVIGKTPRVALCCPYASRLSAGRCFETNATFFRFPSLYRSNDLSLLLETPDRDCFDFFIRYPCKDRQSYNLDPDKYPEDAFKLLDNGSIYKQPEDVILEETEYCFGITDTDAYYVVLCFDDDTSQLKEDSTDITIVFPVGLIVSVPFLFTTFLVYTLLPELKNMHGRTLRGYIGSLLVAYVILFVVQISSQDQISDPLCIAFGTLYVLTDQRLASATF